MFRDARLLIVDDDLRFARAIARWLGARGYWTAIAGSIAEFRHVFGESDFDLVLLDLNLCGQDGLALAAELGPDERVGVIIMTGRDEVADRVRGLDAGADDYLVKPFAMEELGARVRAVLRRRPRLSAGRRLVQLGPVELDPVIGEVRCAGHPRSAHLTERQSAILHRLLSAAGQTVERTELLPGQRWEPGDRSVDVHVAQIRRRLADAGIDAIVISTVRGRGYRLDPVAGGAAGIAASS
jgi:DNA-binding response OmpR family regulator